MNKVLSKIRDFWYSIPFGLQSAENEILHSHNNSISNGTEVTKQAEDSRVGEHLLKGEVTNAVSELRYRTYEVEGESKNYHYQGQGKVEKTNDSKKYDLNKIHFYQSTKQLTNSVLDELKRVDDKNNYGKEEYTLNVKCIEGSFPRFKIERYTEGIYVTIDKQNDEIITTLVFDNLPNANDNTSKSFINELVNAKKQIDFKPFCSSEHVWEAALKRSEITSSIDRLSFTTYKASHFEPDLIQYEFKTPIDYSYTDINGKTHFKITWKSYGRTNLKEQFINSDMKKKYDNKEKKENIAYFNLKHTERKEHCSNCGKEVDVFDASITKYDFGKVLCKECLANYLGIEE